MPIAAEAHFQKFTKVDGLKEILLATEDLIIAETFKSDTVWATGVVNKGYVDDRCKIPSMWRGTNVTGWALMLTR